MDKLKGIKPESVFRYFEEICAVPRGSGNRDGICQYCLKTAEKLGLLAKSDAEKNVVIYKPASAGYEDAEPVILQGHTDMVCQKSEGLSFDFEKDGVRPYIDGDWVRAEGTTLGADNGIAMAMIFAILEDNTLAHPPIEALFTADEEIGLLGAAGLDGSWFSGKRLINLDSEDADTITVSCAGGSEVTFALPLEKAPVSGRVLTLAIRGLQGGHSGVEIDKGRVNANLLMGRILNHIKTPFSLVSVTGGDKGNAIPYASTAVLVTTGAEALRKEAEHYWEIVQKELIERDPDAELVLTPGEDGEQEVMTAQTQEKLIFILTCAPNGIMEMSKSINGLVETSLNLGVLNTTDTTVNMTFALRSNKQSALDALEERMRLFGKMTGCVTDAMGQYPPWEYRSESALRTTTAEVYAEQYGKAPKIEAIHAGLECGVLAAKIDGLDCISIGPDLRDVHTVGERLSIPSTAETYRLLTTLLKRLK
ncbi:MAG: aminoacyl-histidine dipeptidase [Clostridia bacterium]|nr:aminoacyl-histidine dipeptidase [Clostridia bacterium]